MHARSLQSPPAEMPDRLRRRAERLLADGAALHVEAEATYDSDLRTHAIDLVEDAIALFNEFDTDL
jgi:hypothetical protein